MLHSMTIRLMHVHQLKTLYLYYGVSVNLRILDSMIIRLKHMHQLETLYYKVKCQSGVIWGHWGQQVIFNKMLNLNTLHSMTRKPIHEHELETYLQYGVKGQSVVILVSSWGQSGRLRRR